MQLSIPSPNPPQKDRVPLPPRRSQRNQTPAVDLAHVPGLIRAPVPWRRGARRRQPCQRAFEGTPDPEKKKKKRESRWQRGMTPPMHCTCSPPPPRHPPPPCAPIQPVSNGTLRCGGFEVEECLNAAPVHAASHHKAPRGTTRAPPTHFFVTNRGKPTPTPPLPANSLPLLCFTKKTAGRPTNKTKTKLQIRATTST